MQSREATAGIPAQRLDPDYVWTLRNRAVTNVQLGHLEDALADYDTALRLDPNDAWTLFSRGWAKGKFGRYTEAIADYDAVLRLDPSHALALKHREEALAQLATE